MKALSHKLTALPLSAALQVDLQAKQAVHEDRDIINFCVGEPDFPTPEIIRSAGIDAIGRGQTRYTNASGTPELKRAIAQYLERRHGVHYEDTQIAATGGGKYAVYAAISALTDPGDEVLLPAPYWTSYYHIITLAGAVPVVIQTGLSEGFKITPEAVLSRVTPRTKAIILNNPNNPSGAVYSRKEMEALAEVFKACDLYVVADEIYDRFLYTDEPFACSAALNADMYERTILISGVSKAFAMTGWRIGFAAGSPNVIKAVSAMLSHTTGCPNAIAQAAAVAALTQADADSDAMREAFRIRRDHLVEGLSGIEGLNFAVPQGAFYLMLCLTGEPARRYPDGTAFSMALLKEAGVATVPCEDYGYPNAVRLSFSIDTRRLDEGVRRIRAFAQIALEGADHHE